MKKLIVTYIILIIVMVLLSGCGSSKYYKGCDGKRKFKTQMHY